MPEPRRLFFFTFPLSGDEEDRTPDPLLAKQVLSQLSYTPMWRVTIRFNRSSFKETGGLKWNRTIDLTLIRRAL